MAASPHGKRALAAIADLKRVYGLDYDMHGFRQFADAADASGQAPDGSAASG